MSSTTWEFGPRPLTPRTPEPLPLPPFDDARAEITLRSSDGVNFRVFKAILSIASPVFADMFKKIPPPARAGASPNDQVLPQPSSRAFPMSERSGELDFSLRHLYPIRSTGRGRVSLSSVSALAEFARKYRINALTKTITRYLTDSIERDPVDVYAIAITSGYKDIAIKAARSCLNVPFSRLRSPSTQHIAVELHVELLRYHVACGEAASAVALERNWISSLNQDVAFISIGSRSGTLCSSCTTQDYNDKPETSNLYGRIYGPLCLWNYLYRATLVLARHPTAKAVTTEEFILTSNDCPSCSEGTRRRMLELSVVFGREIQKAVERVPLPEAVTIPDAAIDTV